MKALIYEKETIPAMILSRFLIKQGVTIHISKTLANLFETFESENFDYIFCDIASKDFIPEYFEIFDRYSKERDFQIICMANFSQIDISQKMDDFGIDHLLIKPISKTDICLLFDKDPLEEVSPRSNEDVVLNRSRVEAIHDLFSESCSFEQLMQTFELETTQSINRIRTLLQFSETKSALEIALKLKDKSYCMGADYLAKALKKLQQAIESGDQNNYSTLFQEVASAQSQTLMAFEKRASH